VKFVRKKADQEEIKSGELFLEVSKTIHSLDFAACKRFLYAEVFAREHKQEIKKDPAFRRHFQARPFSGITDSIYTEYNYLSIFSTVPVVSRYSNLQCLLLLKHILSRIFYQPLRLNF
jgi:hypothetical protein